MSGIGTGVDFFITNGSSDNSIDVEITADGNSIQDDRLIGKAAVKMIVANNQLTNTGFDFDSETGIISNYPVYNGETHTIYFKA